MYLSKTIAAGILCAFSIKGRSQEFTRLLPGDQVQIEKIKFSNVRNYPGGKANLSDFSGKKILLDFWTKGCSACIEAFPKMEKYQAMFKDHLQILLITKDSEQILASLFKNTSNVKNTKLPMILGDSILAKVCFPHSTVPMHVWIDEKGKVDAITYPSDLTEKNIRQWISGNKPALLQRREIFDEDLIKKVNDNTTSLLDLHHPFMGGELIYFSQIPSQVRGNEIYETKKDPFTVKSSSYYSIIRRFLQGDVVAGSISQNLVNANKEPCGWKIINESIDRLYAKAFNLHGYKSLVFDGKAKLLHEELTDTTNHKRHYFNNNYCYESVLPGFTESKAMTYMQKDLERAFGMTATVEYRLKKVFIISRTDSTERLLWEPKEQRESLDENFDYYSETRISDDGTITLRRTNFSSILGAFWNRNRMSDDPEIVDETGFTDRERKYRIKDGAYKLNFKITENTCPQIIAELAKHGLRASLEDREVKTMIFRSISE